MRNFFFYIRTQFFQFLSRNCWRKISPAVVLRAIAVFLLQVWGFLWLLHKVYLYAWPRVEAFFRTCAEYIARAYQSSGLSPQESHDIPSSGGPTTDVVIAYLMWELGLGYMALLTMGMVTRGLAANRPRNELASDARFIAQASLAVISLVYLTQLSIHVPESSVVCGQLYISVGVAYTKYFLVFSSLFAMSLPFDYSREDKWRPFEFPAPQLLLTLCLLVFVSTNGLIVLCLCTSAATWISLHIAQYNSAAPAFVGVYLHSVVTEIPTRVLNFLRGRGHYSPSSTAVWFGALLVYYVVGDTAYEAIGLYLQDPCEGNDRVVLSIGLLLITLGFLWMLFTIPSRCAGSKTYEEGSLHLLAFHVLVVRPALFATLTRMLQGPFFELHDVWAPAVLYLSLLAATYSALAAFSASKTLDLVRHTSVAQIALLLALFAVAGKFAFNIHALSVIYYSVAFGGFFLLFAGLRKAAGTPLTELSDFRGLWYSEPDLGSILILALLPLAGVTKASFFRLESIYTLTSEYPDAFILFFVIGAVTATFMFLYIRIIATLWCEGGEHVELDSQLREEEWGLLLFLALFLVFVPDFSWEILDMFEVIRNFSKYN